MAYKRPQTHIQWTKWAKQYGLLYRYAICSGPFCRGGMYEPLPGTLLSLFHRVKTPGGTFVVVADPALLPTVLSRPGLPKSRVYELGFFVRAITPLPRPRLHHH